MDVLDVNDHKDYKLSQELLAGYKKDQIYLLLNDIQSFLIENHPESELIKRIDEVNRMVNGIEIYSKLITNKDVLKYEDTDDPHEWLFNLQRICYLFDTSGWDQIKAVNKKYNEEVTFEVQRLINEMYMSISKFAELDKHDLDARNQAFRKLVNTTGNDNTLSRIKAKFFEDFEAKYKESIEHYKRSNYCSFCLEPALTVCCSVASYCSYNCQYNDWYGKKHYINCDSAQYYKNIQENDVDVSDEIKDIPVIVIEKDDIHEDIVNDDTPVAEDDGNEDMVNSDTPVVTQSQDFNNDVDVVETSQLRNDTTQEMDETNDDEMDFLDCNDNNKINSDDDLDFYSPIKFDDGNPPVKKMRILSSSSESNSEEDDMNTG